MPLSQRQIETLIELVDIELKVLDAYREDDAKNGRIPHLETCRMELRTLAAAERTRRKKTFPELSWKKTRPRTSVPVPDRQDGAGTPDNLGVFLRKPE